MSWAAWFRQNRLCQCGHPHWAHPTGLYDRLLSFVFRTACRAPDCQCRRYAEVFYERL